MNGLFRNFSFRGGGAYPCGAISTVFFGAPGYDIYDAPSSQFVAQVIPVGELLISVQG